MRVGVKLTLRGLERGDQFLDGTWMYKNGNLVPDKMKKGKAKENYYQKLTHF